MAKKNATETVTATFKRERDTKNKAVFIEQVADGKDYKVDGIVGTLYVSKTLHEAMDTPETLTVTLTRG